jgi:hypothetical protein
MGDGDARSFETQEHRQLITCWPYTMRIRAVDSSLLNKLLLPSHSSKLIGKSIACVCERKDGWFDTHFDFSGLDKY